MKMKRFLYWFLGDQAGRLLVSGWNLMWGKPLEAGGKLTLEAAKESLTQMQESVKQLTGSVARVMAVYEQAKNHLAAKQKTLLQAEEQAQLAMAQENEEAARIAVAQTIALEDLLPQLKERVEQAESMVLAAQQKLKLEREKLEACKLAWGNLQAISEMNEALNQVMTITSEVGVDSARSRFFDSEQAIQNRHWRINAQFDLSRHSKDQYTADLQQLTQSHAIEQRMEALRQHQSSSQGA
jgi:phage shock protein A